MSRHHSVTGIILRRTVLKESDVMLAILTLEYGKITAIAKGAKSITSRRAPHLQSGSLVTLTLTQSQSGWYVGQSTMRSALYEVKRDPDRLTALTRALFMIDRLLAPDVPEREVFGHFVTLTRDLAQAHTPDHTHTVLVTYANDLMRTLGFIDTSLTWDELRREIEQIIGEKMV